MPNALVVGGPNGAGKSTFAREYLRQKDWRYLSADRIAAEINPDRPEDAKIQAGRAFVRQFDRSIEQREDIVVESTLAGKGIGRMLERLQEAGYTIDIVFIFLSTPDACVQRVRERVQRGGHDVPRPDVIRRFFRSVANFWDEYRYLTDRWYLFSNDEEEFQEVAFGEGPEYVVTDEHQFDTFFTIRAKARDRE